jgi:hypothetical protein
LIADLRAALYWAPAANDPLWALGTAWLGRNPETNMQVVHPAITGIEELTADARHYGLHGTLRPPMQLATDQHAFVAAARTIAVSSQSFALPPLTLRTIDGFLALVLAHECPAMRALADLCVRATEPHRRPASDAELARRRAAGLSPHQEMLLQRWGYPYVMEEFRFHVTLTRRLSAAERDAILPAAQAHFAPALDLPRCVKEICLFTARDTPFVLTDRIPFGKG